MRWRLSGCRTRLPALTIADRLMLPLTRPYLLHGLLLCSAHLVLHISFPSSPARPSGF